MLGKDRRNDNARGLRTTGARQAILMQSIVPERLAAIKSHRRDGGGSIRRAKKHSAIAVCRLRSPDRQTRRGTRVARLQQFANAAPGRRSARARAQGDSQICRRYTGRFAAACPAFR
jgi:hypothetical protein